MCARDGAGERQSGVQVSKGNFNERTLSQMYYLHWCTLRKGACAPTVRWLLGDAHYTNYVGAPRSRP
ncbi:hypothetical protein PSPO01_10031 [Paraphaeosphaeria sporulosa]